MHYEMARNPQRQTGFAGSVLGSDFSNMIGPLDERHKTVRELLNIIAERSRGGMWIGVHSPQWEFIEYQWPEHQGVSMLRWITNLAR